MTTNSDHRITDTSDHRWGCFFPEVADFFSIVNKFGFTLDDIDFVSPNGGNTPIYESKPTFALSQENEQKIRSKLKNTFKPDQIKAKRYCIIYYAGGISCLADFPTSKNVGKIAAKIYENGGIVSAVCDGISGLIPIRLSNAECLYAGRKITTNKYKFLDNGIDVTELLSSNGALVDTSKTLVADKRIITAPGVRAIPVAIESMGILLNVKPGSSTSANFP